MTQIKTSERRDYDEEVNFWLGQRPIIRKDSYIREVPTLHNRHIKRREDGFRCHVQATSMLWCSC